MNIDEAIKYCEEVAEQNEKDIAYYTIQGDKEWLDECEKDCIECAKEHRQLAEWLRELKAYKDAWEDLFATVYEIKTNTKSEDMKEMASSLVNYMLNLENRIKEVKADD